MADSDFEMKCDDCGNVFNTYELKLIPNSIVDDESFKDVCPYCESENFTDNPDYEGN